MLRQGLMFATVVGFAGLDAPSARADLCLHYNSGGGTEVARKATLPAPDTCRPLAFFESGGLAGAATGSICTDRNGAIVILHYDYDSCLGPTYTELATCRLQLRNTGLPTVGGTCRGTANGGSFVDSTATLSNCNIPVPDDIGGLCAHASGRSALRRPAQP